MEYASIIIEVVKWAAEVAARFIEGDSGPEPQRLAAILPPKLRADLEHLRQRDLLAREIREDEAKRADKP